MINIEEIRKITREHKNNTSYEYLLSSLQRDMLTCASLGLYTTTFSTELLHEDAIKILIRDLNECGYKTFVDKDKHIIVIGWNEV